MSIETSTTTKARYWVGVGYPENMRPDWRDVIGEILQLPYAYCIHDKDKDGDEDDRKVHVHVIIAFPNTTTYKSALSTLQELSDEGKQAFPTVKKVNNVRFMYNYLIHDTEDSRKKHKYQYSPRERITGNNFDIGSYEQLSLDEKNSILVELEKRLFEKGYTNYADFFADVMENFSPEYSQVVRGNSGHFSRLTKGLYQRSLKGHNRVSEYANYLFGDYDQKGSDV